MASKRNLIIEMVGFATVWLSIAVLAVVLFFSVQD